MYGSEKVNDSGDVRIPCCCYRFILFKCLMLLLMPSRLLLIILLVMLSFLCCLNIISSVLTIADGISSFVFHAIYAAGTNVFICCLQLLF